MKTYTVTVSWEQINPMRNDEEMYEESTFVGIIGVNIQGNTLMLEHRDGTIIGFNFDHVIRYTAIPNEKTE